MEKGFLFDRVEMNGTGIPVYQAVISPLPILTHSAKTPFPLWNAAPPGAQFTLDVSSVHGGEKGGELYPDKAFFGGLCLQDFRKTKEVGDVKNTETCPAKLQELPFRQFGLSDGLTPIAGSRMDKKE